MRITIIIIEIFQKRPSPVGALTTPNSDLDEFDIITNRSKSVQSVASPINGSNNNNCKFNYILISVN